MDGGSDWARAAVAKSAPLMMLAMNFMVMVEGRRFDFGELSESEY